MNLSIKSSLKGGLSLMAIAAAAVASSCTDDIKFGDKFQEKAPGGTVTIDSVFVNEEYTRGFLANIYSKQYYGLPYNNRSATAWSHNPYRGKLDAVTDCYQLYWAATTVYGSYYQAQLAPTHNGLIAFVDDKVWDCARVVWQFVENVDKCTVIDESLRKRFKAEAKCVLASRYLDLLLIFGGLPIVDHSFTGTEGSYELPRASVEETVNFMVKLIDESINDLPWAYNGNTSDTNSTLNRKRWSRAGAMALKAKILTFAASPIFNADAPYMPTNADNEKLVWYGNYDAARWERAKTACDDFFKALDANGYYALEQAVEKTNNGYRLAYRKGYLLQTSTEPLHVSAVRDYDNWANGYYCWSNWVNLGRNSYLPTFEYMCMFPWSDGTAFDWDKDQSKINDGINSITKKPQPGQLFYKYNTVTAVATASRDPRLYENMIVNGQQASLDWSTAASSGDEYELWFGGYHSGLSTEGSGQMVACYSTGFGVMKYHLGGVGSDYLRLPLQWVVLGLDEMYLLHAECLAQTGDLAGAIDKVQVIRSRVGLSKNLKSAYSALNLDSDKDALMEQILRERACELGMSNARYWDMIRYKRTDWMTKPLHGLRVHRMQQASDGSVVEYAKPYIGDEKNGGANHPMNFSYEVFKLYDRVLWNYENDSNNPEVVKYLLEPLPQSEINKGYGLVQNPGWGN